MKFWSPPPLAVAIREIRPKLKYALVLVWITLRIIFPLMSSSETRTLTPEIYASRYSYVSFSNSNFQFEEDHQSTPYFCKDKHNQHLGIYWWKIGFFDLLYYGYTRFVFYYTNLCHTHKKIQWILSSILLLFSDLIGLLLAQVLLRTLCSIQSISFQDWKDRMIQRMFEFSSEHIPFVKRELMKEETKMETFLTETLKDKKRTITRVLPKVGRDPSDLIQSLEKTSNEENMKWKLGLVSGAVYSGEEEHTDFLNRVYSMYSLANPLHSDLWPSINQFEAEIVSMTAHLLNGTGNVVGATTSGGTESIILAVRAHLHVYGKKRGIDTPEIVCCTTAHAGLDKACDMFNIRLIKISCDPVTFQLVPSKVRRFISSNTILIYASAPSYPQGVIDPIEELSNIAQQYRIGLHVDCCLGGFILPFARLLDGFDVPKFDFACDGVTSISADTHKYGYAHKGTSVVLYRNKALRRAQYFTYGKWTGGLYSTPTIAGSRPGALLACAWASMVTIGESGYKLRTKLILDAARFIADKISHIPGLRLLGGKPKAMVVCFTSDGFNIYRVADAMTKRGWSLNSLQSPPCLHICLTVSTARHADKFVGDLIDVVALLSKDDDTRKEGSVAIYGMAGSMPAGPVNELLKVYNDVMLTC